MNPQDKMSYGDKIFELGVIFPLYRSKYKHMRLDEKNSAVHMNKFYGQ